MTRDQGNVVKYCLHIACLYFLLEENVLSWHHFGIFGISHNNIRVPDKPTKTKKEARTASSSGN